MRKLSARELWDRIDARRAHGLLAEHPVHGLCPLTWVRPEKHSAVMEANIEVEPGKKLRVVFMRPLSGCRAHETNMPVYEE